MYQRAMMAPSSCGRYQSTAGLLRFRFHRIFGANAEIMNNIEGGQSLADGTIVMIQPLIALMGHVDKIVDIFLNKNSSNLIVSASLDRTVRVWDACKGVELRKIGLDVPGTSVLMDPQEERAFLGTRTGVIKAFGLHSNASTFTVTEDGNLQRDASGQVVRDFTGHK